MKLYLISQDLNNGYDTYDSAVVAARNEEEAKNTKVGSIGDYGAWVTPDKVQVKLIGTAIKVTKAGVVLASFNAG